MMYFYDGFYDGKHWVFDGLGGLKGFKSEKAANLFVASDLNKVDNFSSDPEGYPKRLEKWREQHDL